MDLDEALDITVRKMSERISLWIQQEKYYVVMDSPSMLHY